MVPDIGPKKGSARYRRRRPGGGLIGGKRPVEPEMMLAQTAQQQPSRWQMVVAFVMSPIRAMRGKAA